MADASLPIVKVHIRPHFDKNGHATNLYVRLTFNCPELLQGSTTSTHPASFLYAGNGSRLTAADEEGELDIIFEPPQVLDKPMERRWKTSRETSGPVKILHKVKVSPGGSVYGLHSDGGGLLGSGLAVVPILPAGQSFRNIVRWQLEQAPEGTRAVWTYGEGPHSVERIGPASLLWGSVYMVGNIQSNPPAAATGTISDHYGYYWFGQLPQNIENIKNIHHRCFVNAQNIFQPDDNNTADFEHPFFANLAEADRKCIVDPLPYRSFVRNTGSTKSFGGTTFGHSHIFNYDDQIHKAHDFDLVRRMAYEMAQIWFGCSPLDAPDWLCEGICHYLSIYIPDRFQKLRGDYYIKSTINILCNRYHTSPLIHEPLSKVLNMADTAAYAREHVSARSWAFVFGVDMRARVLTQKSEDKLHIDFPIEKIAMIALANNKARGSSNDSRKWMELLTPLMGNEIQQRYTDFYNGTPIQAPECLTGFNGYYPHTVKDLVLDFGMARESFSEGVVKDLQEFTRAYIAGIKNGDTIVQSSHQWRCVDDSAACMELAIERDGKQLKIKYLPRAWEEAEGWELREIREEEHDIEEHDIEEHDTEEHDTVEENSLEEEGKSPKRQKRGLVASANRSRD